MADTSKRQQELLRIVVEDYISSAKPVGSVEMVRKHGLKVSAATVRNEMVRLIDNGLVAKTHSSSGRVPTPMGLRRYLESLMEEVSVPVLTEVAIKQRLWPDRFEFEKFLRKLTLALSENTGYLSFASIGDGCIFHAGAVSILNHPEFFDIEVTRAVLGLLDHEELLLSLTRKASAKDEPHILLGEELDDPSLKPISLVFCETVSASQSVIFGVIGPSRLEYKKVLPLMRFFRSLLSEVTQNPGK